MLLLDDADVPHTRHAGRAQRLRGDGVRAYLDSEQIMALAEEHGCDCIHPAWGFPES